MRALYIRGAFLNIGGNMKEIGIYIHIPFCQSKCYYCDFVSFEGKENLVDKYIENLMVELKLYKELVKDSEVKTIFIGGGTPSHIDSNYIKRIMEFIKRNFNTKSLKEVTIEVNPGTLDRIKAKTYKEAGINRVSMGVQTLNNSHLKAIGRIHKEEEVYESLEILKEAGFDNINLDFIFGLPDETIEDVEENLKKIELLKVSHISYYGLILEEGTPLYQADKSKDLKIPSDSLERNMYYLIKKRLKSMGYIHYEISNFALQEKECKHNILYWEIKPYIGVGLASHSFIDNRRHWNHENFNDYFSDLEKQLLPIEDGEDISLEVEISEFAIMGLRLIKGIDKSVFKKRFRHEIGYFYNEIIEKHLKDGLLIEDESYIKLSSKGLDLSNIVEVDFLLY